MGIEEVILEEKCMAKAPIPIVLDTDAYNEVDDQFALAYAVRSPELMVEAVYAAPFFNDRSESPQDGMEKSYAEVGHILDILHAPQDVFKGSRGYLKDSRTPQESDAARDLVKRAMACKRLYVAAIGAITNIASAILMEPAIIDRIVVIWLGGHALYLPDTDEFNLRQDVNAARIVFDSGVPLVHIPCQGVASHLITTVPELTHYLSGSDIGAYLTDIVKYYRGETFGGSKVIWDIAVIAWLINPDWVPTQTVPSPLISDKLRWKCAPVRHPIRSAVKVDRDRIFADLFRKLR